MNFLIKTISPRKSVVNDTDLHVSAVDPNKPVTFREGTRESLNFHLQ